MVRNKWERSFMAAGCAVLILLMSGCLYPQEQTPGNQASSRSAVAAVQDAVERYQEATGLLPIQNADSSVPVYEKFKIDFAKMKRTGYVESVSKLAFENGGSYVFLIIDEETNPVVKLLDIAVYQGISNVQQKVDAYRKSHNGANPAREEAGPGFRYVDFDKLGISQPKLDSMYSHRPLELMIDESGRVYADYRIDIADAMKKAKDQPLDDKDLRRYLIAASDFVPVKSPVYAEVNGEPEAVAPSA